MTIEIFYMHYCVCEVYINYEFNGYILIIILRNLILFLETKTLIVLEC